MQFIEGDVEKDLDSDGEGTGDEGLILEASPDANTKHFDSLCLVEQVGFKKYFTDSKLSFYHC